MTNTSNYQITSVGAHNDIKLSANFLNMYCNLYKSILKTDEELKTHFI